MDTVVEVKQTLLEIDERAARNYAYGQVLICSLLIIGIIAATVWYATKG